MSVAGAHDPSENDDPALALAEGLARCRELVSDLERKLKAPHLEGEDASSGTG
jgi:hypothetical protein